MYDDPDAKVGASAAHLEGCAECQARFKTVSDDARSVATLFAVPDARVDMARAYARVTAEPKAQPRLGLRFPILRPVARPTLALVAAVGPPGRGRGRCLERIVLPADKGAGGAD